MKQCPLFDAYRFRTSCRVCSCKMYTDKTESRCLALDTTFASNDKTLSDAELVHYKFNDLTQREVASVRKRAVNRVRAVIALHSVIQHVQAKERPENGLNRALMQHLSSDAKRLLKKSFRSKLFGIRPLGIEAWMMPFVLDQEYTQKIVPQFDQFAIHLLFRWTASEFKTVADSISNARKFHGHRKTATHHAASSRANSR